MSLIIYWGLFVDKMRIKLLIVKICLLISKDASLSNKNDLIIVRLDVNPWCEDTYHPFKNVGWGVLFLASSGTWFMELRNVCPPSEKGGLNIKVIRLKSSIGERGRRDCKSLARPSLWQRRIRDVQREDEEINLATALRCRDSWKQLFPSASRLFRFQCSWLQRDVSWTASSCRMTHLLDQLFKAHSQLVRGIALFSQVQVVVLIGPAC